MICSYTRKVTAWLTTARASCNRTMAARSRARRGLSRCRREAVGGRGEEKRGAAQSVIPDESLASTEGWGRRQTAPAPPREMARVPRVAHTRTRQVTAKRDLVSFFNIRI